MSTSDDCSTTESSPGHRSFDYRFRLAGSLAVRMAPLFEGLVAEAPVEASTHLRHHVLSLDQIGNDTLALQIDGTTTFQTSDPGALLHQAVWEVTRRGVASRPADVMLHAAAAVLGTRTILISGPSGSGKSTLVTALIDEGASYVTDEAVRITPSGTVAEGLARPVHLSSESLAMLHRSPCASDVAMPGGGAYLIPERLCRTGIPSDTIVIQLGQLGGELHAATSPRSTMIAGLARESLSAAASRQGGLECLKNLSKRSVIWTMRGGSAAERAIFVKDRVMGN